MRETEVINRLFGFATDESVQVGIGDDAAVVLPRSPLAVSCDTLVENVHFFAADDAFFLARKSVAVSLSDMAAMGAKPLWLTVALATSGGGEWLQCFANGIADIAKEFNVAVIGGDLCRAQTIAVATTVIGGVDKPIIRGGAKSGDDVWLSGTIGEAAAALAIKQADKKLSTVDEKTFSQFGEKEKRKFFNRLQNPAPRVALGLRINNIATAATDLSDGLLAAAKNIATASKIKIIMQESSLPAPPSFAKLPPRRRREFVLGGGDDFELLFTAPKNRRDDIINIARDINLTLTRTGEVFAGDGVVVTDENGEIKHLPQSYEHEFGD